MMKTKEQPNGHCQQGLHDANGPLENGTAAADVAEANNGQGPSDFGRIDRLEAVNNKVARKGKKKMGKGRRRTEEEPDELAKLGKIKDLPKLEERIKLAIQKMQLCQRVHDFHDYEAELSSKEAKRQALEELLDFLRAQKGAISEKFYGEVFALVSANIFRDLPPREDELRPAEFELAAQSGPGEEAEFGNCLDPAWLHLEWLYEIFLHFLSSLEFRATLAKKFIDQDFVLKLIGLLQSEDPRERAELAKILRRIYAKFIRLRPFIRKQVSYCLLAFVHEQANFWGVAELLDVLQCVVDDFRVPLKADSKQLLLRVLLPLYRPNKCFSQYHSRLTDRVVQFVHLDCALTEPVVEALLKCWPNTNSEKELHFVEEIQRILSAVTELEQFRKVVGPLFRRISKCISSNHCQVAMRALLLWKEPDERISKLFRECNAEITPLVFPALRWSADCHWNKNVQKAAKDVQNVLAEMNWKLWNKLVAAEASQQREEVEAEAEEDEEDEQDDEDDDDEEEDEEEEDEEEEEEKECEKEEQNKEAGAQKEKEVGKEEKKEEEKEEKAEKEVEDEEEWEWEYEDEEEWEWEYEDEEEEETTNLTFFL